MQPIRIIRDYLTSLAGRIALILMMGMASASIGSLLIVEAERKQAFLEFRAESLAISAADITKRLKQRPRETEQWLKMNRIFAAHLVPSSAVPHQTGDPLLQRSLEQHLGKGTEARGFAVPLELCFGKFEGRYEAAAAGQSFIPLEPECWVVQMPEIDGRRLWVAFDLPPMRLPPTITLNPTFLALIIFACAALSVLVSRIALAPLRRLADAARAFSRSMDADPIPERGPSDVRAALVTFNAMQRAVREGVRERTRILAAISHDLQTPLTRMRLRLENIIDNQKRERLVADLSVMQSLVREGLELARSSESAEDWSIIDVDSLLSSMAEDWTEMGSDVHIARSCRAKARVKPDALTRCVSNLIENAVKYGKGAELGCALSADIMVIEVRDHGPGIPPDKIEKMFEPFVRGEQSRSRSTGGTGIGLTIARAQANTFGGAITLTNHPDGGLSAKLIFACGV